MLAVISFESGGVPNVNRCVRSTSPEKIEARLDVINRVQRISWIAELKSYPANAALTRVVVRGVHVFVMDRHNGKVYHHELDETQKALKPDAGDPVLLNKGAQVSDILVGDLVEKHVIDQLDPTGIEQRGRQLDAPPLSVPTTERGRQRVRYQEIGWS